MLTLPPSFPNVSVANNALKQHIPQTDLFYDSILVASHNLVTLSEILKAKWEMRKRKDTMCEYRCDNMNQFGQKHI